jgi:hypothetical protein
MVDETLLSLAKEYLDLIESMRSGRFSITELHQLDGDRQWLHNELLRLTSIDPADDMAAYCRRLLHIARSSGQ